MTIVVNGGKRVNAQSSSSRTNFHLLAFIHIVLVFVSDCFSSFTFGLMNFELKQKIVLTIHFSMLQGVFTEIGHVISFKLFQIFQHELKSVQLELGSFEGQLHH